MSTGAGQSAGAKARAARAAAARAERERKARVAKLRNLAIAIGVVVVLAIAAVIVIPRLKSSSSSTVATPAGLTAYKGVEGAAFGPATAPVTITLFEDFQCPVCLHLEQTTGAEFTNLADAGRIRVIYSVVSILDRESNGNQYSTRSASAFYADQPAENGHGRTDAQILATAKRAGISSAAFTADVDHQTYAGYAEKQTTYAGDHDSQNGSFGTPTMLVNGTLYPGVLTITPAILDQVVAQAGSS